MEKMGKSRRQDTKDWSDRDQKQRLRTRVRQLEKQLKQARKELERERMRNSNIQDILENEDTSKFDRLLSKEQLKSTEDKNICPNQNCDNELYEFSVPHPTYGKIIFEKCECGFKRQVKRGA